MGNYHKAWLGKWRLIVAELKILIIGSTGTIASTFVSYLESLEDELIDIVKWNRKKNPLANLIIMENEISKIQPDYIFNFAVASSPSHIDTDSEKVNIDLPEVLSSLSKKYNYKYIHLSSVMVFSEKIQGPFTPASKPNANEGYGLEKKTA